MKETVTLNSEEQRRLLILNQVERGVVSVADAAELMGVSVRQVHRLRTAYRDEGAAALVHGNRGRTPCLGYHRHPTQSCQRMMKVAMAKPRHMLCPVQLEFA